MIRKNQAAAAVMTAGLILYGSLVLTTALSLPQTTKKKPVKTAAKSATPAAKPSTDLVPAGKKIYDANGCATCHAIAGKGGSSGPELTHTGDDPTHTVDWLSAQVANPKAHNPGSTMPPFAGSIKGKDLTAIGTYLASLKSVQAALPTSNLPPAPPPDPAAIARVAKLGGTAGPIAQNDNHLDVSFHLLGNTITDPSLAVLSSLKGTVHLDLGMTGISDAGLVYVKGLKDLSELHLEGTRVTDAGLVSLEPLHSLEYLNLYATNITDAGLDHLSRLTKLRHLYVWQTKVTDDGVNKLKKALPQLDVVQGFDQAPKK